MSYREGREHDETVVIHAPAVKSRRPTPSLIIGAAMLTSWLITSLAYDWPAFREVAGLTTVVALLLLVRWAKVE